MSGHMVPSSDIEQEHHTGTVALVLCGALAREVRVLAAEHAWPVELFGVNAQHHMQPQRIAPAVEARLRELIPRFSRIIVVYGDCGTANRLDDVLAHYNVPRIAGPHCYEMYAGATFDGLMDEEPGTFFLTDFLVRGFSGTVVKGLGLDRFPELQDIYFANYKRLVYLAQKPDDGLIERAHAIADTLRLPLEVRFTGYGKLATRLLALMAEIHDDRYCPRLPAPLEEHTHGNLPDPLLARHPTPGARTRRRRAG